MTAEEYRLDGDEELAYITYMKYFNMLTAIHKKSDYPSHKTTVRQMLGDTESNRRIMDTLEEIINSLRHRYAQQHQAPEPIAPDLVSNGRAGVDSPITQPTQYARLGLITCQDLYRRMQEKSVLVMDCRPSADYEDSHLTYYCAFNVPEELITPGWVVHYNNLAIWILTYWIYTECRLADCRLVLAAAPRRRGHRVPSRIRWFLWTGTPKMPNRRPTQPFQPFWTSWRTWVWVVFSHRLHIIIIFW